MAKGPRGRNNSHYRYTNTISFFGDSVRAAALELFTRVGSMIVPFIMWPVVAILGGLIGWQWHANIYVIAFLIVASIVISVLTWALPPKGFNSTCIHASVTVWLYAALLGSIDVAGWTKFNLFMMIAAVPIVCLTWSVRIAIENNQAGGLEDIFEQAGIPGASMTVHKVDDS